MKKPLKKPENNDERSQAETEQIAANTLKTLLNTPPKPFTPKAKGKSGAEVQRSKRS